MAHYIRDNHWPLIIFDFPCKCTSMGGVMCMCCAVYLFGFGFGCRAPRSKGGLKKFFGARI